MTYGMIRTYQYDMITCTPVHITSYGYRYQGTVQYHNTAVVDYGMYGIYGMNPVRMISYAFVTYDTYSTVDPDVPMSPFCTFLEMKRYPVSAASSQVPPASTAPPKP